MNSTAAQQIMDKYGARATDSPFERALYSRDLAPVPALLVSPLFRTVPDLVVRPVNTAEVAALMKMAFQYHIPVTPRAGGSTVYFDSVPIKGGILLDLNLIKGVVAVDESAMTATVRAATTWCELEAELARQGLAAKSFPSSAPVATIGGWYAMMGYGIGSLKYGSLASQVLAMEVVTPEGEVLHLDRDSQIPMSRYAESEGTLGIITQLEIEVRRQDKMKHFLLQCPSAVKMVEIMHSLVKSGQVPYNMHFTEPACLQQMQNLNIAAKSLRRSFLLSVDYEGTEEEMAGAQQLVEQLAGSDPTVSILPAAMAEQEWEEKFLAMRLKRGGPSILGAELWLPIKNLPQYLLDVEKLSDAYKLGMFSYGHVVTDEYATVMTSFYADETRTVQYIINLSLVKKLQDIGHEHGGHPYGIGLWNSPLVQRVHSPDELEKMRARKQRIDKANIMNPGKIYRAPLLLNPFNYALAMGFLAGIRKMFGKGW